ncbi:MAG: hemerythrin family protein [Desulfobacteraceae bacterium]|nr:hemerythrin family protein [Desulfobacteraceae bacterium]
MLIQWTEQMSVGVIEIDEQHKQLIVYINKLYDSLKIKKNQSRILQNILNSLIQYTIVHFAVEESLMRIFDYSEYEAHKKQHMDLKKQVLELNSKIKKGEAKLTKEVIIFLRDWIRNHILQEDKQYSPFFTKQLIGRDNSVGKKSWLGKLLPFK